MYFHLASFKNFHSKPLYLKCFVGLKANHRKNSNIISFRPVFVSKNTVANYVNNYKYLQCLLKKSKINDFEILRRSLSTSSRLFNEKKDPKDSKDPVDPDNSGNRKFAAIILIGIITFLLLQDLTSTNVENAPNIYISWEEFKNEMLAKGEVKGIVVYTNYHLVVVKLHPGAVIKNRRSQSPIYVIEVPDIQMFENKLREAEANLGISPRDGVPVLYNSGGIANSLFTRLLGIAAIALIIGSILYFKNFKFKFDVKLKFDFWGFRKAKYTLVDPLVGEGKGVKFSDVAGLKEAKTEILDFVDYLKRPEVYRNLGAKVPKGALLLGPPGCGKTLLAKAVATEANVPFLSMNGSEFIEIIGGLGAARVRDLFKEAKKRSPCIIYIDEIDAIGKKRESRGSRTGVGEEEQTLNQLLVEMDGVVSNEGVVLLASTNRADVLDAALLRAGRFDRQILIDLPTFEERKEIFEQHLKGIHLEQKPSVYSKRMAHLTPGFSGADIANVCNEAALHAARIQKKIVQGEDLEYAVERVVGGTEKRSSAISPEEKRLLAYYEAGRALVGWLSQYGEALLKITIVSRTDSPAGWTHFSPVDRFLYSTDDLKGKMCMGLGGRVALTLLFNRVTTAGEKDLKKVTKLAYAQIRRFGMNDKIGLMSFDVDKGGNLLKKPYSKALAALFDQEAKKLVAETYKECEKILVENKDKLVKLAEELLVKETLNYEDVVKLIGPPLYKGKKFVEPSEFALSLDQAAGSDSQDHEPSNESKNM